MANEIQYGLRFTAKANEAVAGVRALGDELKKTGDKSKITADEEKKLAGEFDQLLKRIDPAYRATKQYNDGLDTLKRGLDAGLISQKQFNNGVALLNREASQAAKTVGGDLAAAVGKLGLVALAASQIGQIPRQVIAATIEAEQASARVDATLKATGDSAKISREKIDELANSLAATTQFDDESLLNAQAQFLKFGNIQEQVFTRGIKLSADLAAFMGTDVPSAAQLVGSALASPAEASGRLERQIGKLTDAQEESIKKFIEQGDVMAAQTELLNILEAKLGGTAEKMNNGFTKATADSAKAWDELMEAMGRSEKVQGAVNTFFEGITSNLNGLKKVVEGGTWIDNLLLVMGLKPTVDYLSSRNSPGQKANANAVPGVTAISSKSVMPLTAGSQIQAVSGLETGGGYGPDINKRNDKLAADARRAADAARRAADAEKNAADNFIQSLTKQAETLGMTKEQLLAYDAAHLKLSESQKRVAANTIAQITAFNQQKQAEKDALEFALDFEQRLRESDDRELAALEDQSAAEADHTKQLEEKAQAIRELLDPTITLMNTQAEMNELVAAGVLTEDEATAAINKMGDEAGKTKSAAKDIGLTFASAFEDAALGGKKFSQVLQSLAQDIEKLILRKTITQPILDGVGNWFDKQSLPPLTGDGGGIGDWFSGLFGGGRATGGGVSRGMFYEVNENSPELLNVGGKNYLMMGGNDGYVSPPAAKLSTPVSTGNGGNVTVNIIGAPAQPSVQKRSDGNGNVTIDVMFERIEGWLGNRIAKGEGLAQPLQSRFGLAGGYSQG